MLAEAVTEGMGRRPLDGASRSQKAHSANGHPSDNRPFSGLATTEIANSLGSFRPPGYWSFGERDGDRHPIHRSGAAFPLRGGLPCRSTTSLKVVGSAIHTV